MRIHFVTALPGLLEANSVYFERPATAANAKMFVTNSAAIAVPVDGADPDTVVLNGAAASITSDAGLRTNLNFTLTMTVNATLELPANLVVAGVYVWRVTAGGNDLSYATEFDWGSDGAPTLSGGTDLLVGHWDGTEMKMDFKQGF